MKIVSLIISLAAIQAAVAQTPAPAKSAAEANNAFAFKLLAETRKQGPRDNVFQSPLGLELALGMLENGAQGETLAQMRDALQQTGLSLEALNKANQSLMADLTAGKAQVTLEIANSVWTGKNAPIKKSFLDQAHDFYQAQAAGIDFKDASAIKTINKWASGKTHGRIANFLQPPLDPQTRMILMDAVYFKGLWETPFKSSRTSKKPFHLADGSSATRPLMARTDQFSYLENDQFQAVLLPYRGGQMNMFVLLPKQGLEKFAPALTPENLRQWTGQLRPREGLVELPRFTMEGDYGLNDTLTRLGMARAFTAEAEFGGISDEPLLISCVKQKTFLEVNEEGTEAAAVSGISVAPGAAAPRPVEPPFSMIVDHPFYLAIVDSRTDAILFHGMIFDPSPITAASGGLR